MIEQISIKDFIESDVMKSLDEDYAKWDKFEIVPSNKSHERYPLVDTREGNTTRTYLPDQHETINNTIYAIGMDGLDVGYLKKEIGKTLIGLRNVAMAIKPEGWAVGRGKLVIQSRMNILITKNADFNEFYLKKNDQPDGPSQIVELTTTRHKIMWYGAITKVSEGCDLSSPMPREVIYSELVND